MHTHSTAKKYQAIYFKKTAEDIFKQNKICHMIQDYYDSLSEPISLFLLWL